MPSIIESSPSLSALYHEAMTGALTAAAASLDPSTQNGAVLLVDGEATLTDCNRFPDGVRYSAERWERPLKYSFIEHAERNIVYAAARAGIATAGATLVCPWTPCPDCARAIVQAGVAVFARLPHEVADEHQHWRQDIGDIIMLEGGAKIVDLDPARLGPTPWLRRNGAPWHAQGEQPTQVLSLPGRPGGHAPR